MSVTVMVNGPIFTNFEEAGVGCLALRPPLTAACDARLGESASAEADVESPTSVAGIAFVSEVQHCSNEDDEGSSVDKLMRQVYAAVLSRYAYSSE
jgi:hypothetical protein